MLNNAIKKGGVALFFPYLILAILGSFSFSIGESYCYESFNREIFGINSYIPSVNYTMDWDAEDTGTTITTYGQRNSNFRNGLFRVFAIAEIINTTVCFSKSYCKKSINDYIPITKNQILLKLRI